MGELCSRADRKWSILGRASSEIEPSGRTYAQIDGDCNCADSYGRLPFGCFCGRPSDAVNNNASDDDDDDDDDAKSDVTVITRDDLDSRAPSPDQPDPIRTKPKPQGASTIRSALHGVGRGISMARVSLLKHGDDFARAIRILYI